MNSWIQIALIGPVAGVLVWSAVGALRHRRLPNTDSVLVIGFFIVYALLGYADLLNGVIAAVIVFVPGILLFKFNALGGGDVKLITAFAFWMGTPGVLTFCLYTAITGGLLAVGYLVAPHLKTSGGAEIDTRNKELPYGVAIAIAGLASIWQFLLMEG